MPCRRCAAKPARTRGLCPPCYENERRRIVWESSYVDAEPVRAHIRALRAAGIGNKRLRLLSGVSHNTIQVIMTGRPERGSGPTKKVWRRTAEKLLTVPVPETPHAAVADGAKVPALGTRRRLQALVAFGYSRTQLCQRIGMDITNGCRLFRDDQAAVTAATARTVEALFRELHMTPGLSVRARNEGRRRGWPMPMEWEEDTIDDPNAVPAPDTRDGPLNWGQQYSELKQLGYNDVEILRKFGSTASAMCRQMERYKLRPSPALLAEVRHERQTRRRRAS